MSPRTFSAIVFAILLAAGVPAHCADRSLGTFKDWSTLAFGDEKNLTCMAFTQPVKSKGEYTRRGDVFVFVTHRPGAGQKNQLSVETGYTYDSGIPVTLTIDARTFSLSADGSAAWLADSEEAPKLLAAMKAGRVMRLDGTSSRGTRTVDEYSLLGFTAAANALDKTCR